MSKEKSETQKTPKGYEIPVPRRAALDKNLDKVAKAAKRSTPKRSPAK